MKEEGKRCEERANNIKVKQNACVCVGGIGKVIHGTVHRYTGGHLFSIHSPVIERCMGRLRLSGMDL